MCPRDETETRWHACCKYREIAGRKCVSGTRLKGKQMKWIGAILVFFLMAGTAASQQLTVKSASSTKVDLMWSGSSPTWIVERKSGETFEKVADAKSTDFEDDKIAPYATYIYRVRASATAAPSNTVTVGPPPLGLLKPAPAPKAKGHDSDDYGYRSALALDSNGDPAIAFLWRDPNATNHREESEIMFVQWNRAKYKWDEPRKVAVIGKINPEAGEPISMAFDASTSTIALVYPVADQKGFTLALSKDGGATWQPTSYTTGMKNEINSSTLLISKGHVYLAANQQTEGPFLLDGQLSADPGSWQKREPPVVGREHHGDATVALALDAQGKPFMAFYDINTKGKDGYLFNVWQPDSGKVVTVSDTNGDRPDAPNLKLAAGGGKLAILMAMNPDAKDQKAGIWASESQDGTTWTKAVPIPHDAARSSGGSMSIAINTKGAMFVGFSSPSGSAPGACGNAHYARSTDGVTWTQCAVAKDVHDEFSTLSPTKNVTAAPDDTFYYFWNEGHSTKNGPGLLIWHTR